MEETTIGEAFNLKSGKQLSKSKMIPGDHPVFGGNGISGYHNQYLFKKPKIVIGRVGAYCGNVQRSKPFSWITDNALYIDEKFFEYDDSYLEYLLRSLDLKQYSSQSGQPLISQGRINKVKIPLPTLSEQKAIVAKLDRAQRLIDIDREMLAKYDELIQSVFLEMFGDPVRNEKGWEVKPLKKIAEIDKESFDPTDFNGSVNYVGLNCIVKETGKIIDVETITEGDVKSTKFKFSPNHILYGKLRPYLNKVAFPDFHGVCSTDILPILPKEGISTRSYIGHLLKSKEFVNYADKNSSGANLPRISPTMIKKFEAIHPPFNLQKKFEEILNKVNFEKSKTSQALKKSEELFSSLVQGVFG